MAMDKAIKIQKLAAELRLAEREVARIKALLSLAERAPDADGTDDDPFGVGRQVRIVSEGTRFCGAVGPVAEVVHGHPLPIRVRIPGSVEPIGYARHELAAVVA